MYTLCNVIIYNTPTQTALVLGTYTRSKIITHQNTDIMNNPILNNGG